jgi:hypothetical protein
VLITPTRTRASGPESARAISPKCSVPPKPVMLGPWRPTHRVPGVLPKRLEESRPAELATDVLDEQLVGQVVDRARASGPQLTGEGGLLQQLTERVLESALEGEITDHLGYEKRDPAGAGPGASASPSARPATHPPSRR